MLETSYLFNGVNSVKYFFEGVIFVGSIFNRVRKAIKFGQGLKPLPEFLTGFSSFLFFILKRTNSLLHKIHIT